MKMIADLHVHSRFSRATSSSLDVGSLVKWAKVKGVGLLGTGDFMHPSWVEELRKELKEDGSGILRSAEGFPFVLQNEISLMYSKGGKGRRVHLILLAPSFEVVEKIANYFKKFGRVDYDGRPIFGLDAEKVVEDLRGVSEEIEIIPAHVWTPWFGALGSNSGFDSFEEAFGSQVKEIHALETGLSSDPLMNWRLSCLDKFSILSFSDLHSFWPWRLGREASIFEFKELSYGNVLKAIRGGSGLKGTVEVDPGYGKYHLDGHRNCGFVSEPAETRELKGVCPKCGKGLTVGVLSRVEELADRAEGVKREGAKEFYSLLPLHELIAAVVGNAVSSKGVWSEYDSFIKKFGNEFDVLLNVSLDELKEVNEKVAEMVLRNREGGISVEPGFDGEYGKIVEREKQTKLF